MLTSKLYQDNKDARPTTSESESDSEAICANPGRFALRQLRFVGPYQSEIEWLHALEQCPERREELDKILNTPGLSEEMLRLWKSLDRQHPVVLRGLAEVGRLDLSQELMAFLEWTWNLQEKGEQYFIGVDSRSP